MSNITITSVDKISINMYGHIVLNVQYDQSMKSDKILIYNVIGHLTKRKLEKKIEGRNHLRHKIKLSDKAYSQIVESKVFMDYIADSIISDNKLPDISKVIEIRDEIAKRITINKITMFNADNGSRYKLEFTDNGKPYSILTSYINSSGGGPLGDNFISLISKQILKHVDPSTYKRISKMKLINSSRLHYSMIPDKIIHEINNSLCEAPLANIIEKSIPKNLREKYKHYIALKYINK